MTAKRVAEIEHRLTQALLPDFLEVIDESHLHVGHAGARDGRGHFRVRIQAAALQALTRMLAHRRIHAALGDMMRTDIHALSIEIVSDI